MPALASVSPEIFKAILERYGFKVHRETEYNWVLYKLDAPRPIVTVPKKGNLVPVWVMEPVLNDLKIDNGTWFQFLNEVRPL